LSFLEKYATGLQDYSSSLRYSKHAPMALSDASVCTSYFVVGAPSNIVRTGAVVTASLSVSKAY